MTHASVSFDIDFAIDKSSRSRKAALMTLAQRIGELRTAVPAQQICGLFLAREKLGSTAVGAGAAVPHTILEKCCAPLVQVTVLRNAIDFDASDEAPIDLLLAVIGNRHDVRWLHLAIPRLTKLAHCPQVALRLRSAKNVGEVDAVMATAGIHSQGTLLPKAA